MQYNESELEIFGMNVIKSKNPCETNEEISNNQLLFILNINSYYLMIQN